MHKFKELKVWQEGMELAKMVYQASRSFPAEERFNLTSQINRAAVSVPSNIAEGAGRNSNKEFAQFLNVSLGSSFEIETQMLLAIAFGYVEEENAKALFEQLDKTQRMINSFRTKLLNN